MAFQKGNISHNKGKNKSNYEPLRKTSGALKGYKQTDEHKKNQRESRRKNGWFKNPEEHSIRISKKLMNHEVTEKTRKKLSLAQKGRTYEEIHGLEKANQIKRELSEIKLKNPTKYWLNKKRSIEERRKMGETRKRLFKEGKIKLPSKSFKKGDLRLIGENNPFYGKHHTKEIREKLKEARAKQILPFQDTKIEQKIQNYLKLLHVEFVTHHYISEITHSYQCDILIPKQETRGVIIPQKTIIECDGCYWHGCPICNNKMNNHQKEWIKRDKIRTKELIEKGYRIIRLWEHDINKMELNDLKRIF